MEPFIKAVGGKRWLASKLASEILAASPKLYVEPFVGGGAVALTLSPALPKIVADANPAFIAVWRALRAYAPEALLAELAQVYKAYPDTAFGYVQAREAIGAYLQEARPLARDQPIDPATPLALPPLRFAALTLYLNARCFNGLWRVNSASLMNTPWGRRKQPRRLTAAELRAYQYALTATQAVCADFRQVLAGLAKLPRADRSHIAIYADPPYDGTFTGYVAEGFDETDQRDLARWLKYAADLGMRVWATNADTPLIRELYAWAHIEAITEMHVVGAKGSCRGERNCLLIRNR